MLGKEILVTPESLRSGSQSVFKNLFSTYYEALCRYGYTIMRDMDEAEDIVQKMFCKLWDQRKELSIRTSVKSYLYRAVHNDCMNRIKQQKLHSNHNNSYAYTAYPSSLGSSQEDLLAYNELQQQIKLALEALPPKCREVFELSRGELLSYAEIGERLSLSVNTVENHMSKALKLMRHGLKDFLPVFILISIKIARVWEQI